MVFVWHCRGAAVKAAKAAKPAASKKRKAKQPEGDEDHQQQQQQQDGDEEVIEKRPVEGAGSKARQPPKVSAGEPAELLRVF
jgi:hypothetical protein